jgi:hypothetical protein
MCFAILLSLATLMFTAVIPARRIDSPEEFAISLERDRTWAVPLAFAVFLLIATLPRPAVSKRMMLATFIGMACWLLVWRFLVHCDYTQLRVRGVDPDKVLQSAKPQ